MRLAINAMISSKTIICWESYDTKNALIYEGMYFPNRIWKGCESLKTFVTLKSALLRRHCRTMDDSFL